MLQIPYHLIVLLTLAVSRSLPCPRPASLRRLIQRVRVNAPNELVAALMVYYWYPCAQASIIVVLKRHR